MSTGADGTHTPLVCPACRHVAADGLHVRLLSTGEYGVLACDCGALYPVVDDVPIVVRDLDGWLASEGIEAVRRSDLPPAAEALLVRGAAARNDSLVRVYAASREGPLQSWLRARCAELPGPLLELGAGMGVTGRADVLAVDLNLALLRHHPGARVCADVLDPPLLPESFDTVVLANVLDSVRDPALALAQADALLRPGGTLVTTCAYAFDDTVPEAKRFTPAALLAALAGDTPFGGFPLSHADIRVEDPIAWPLRLSGRTVHTHEVQAIISVKRPRSD